jgi:hypothetical protein
VEDRYFGHITTFSILRKKKVHRFKWTFNQCFLSKLWCRCVGNHQKENLAKFGYRLERKVKKFKNHTICWQHARTYCLNMADYFFEVLIMWGQKCAIFFLRKAFELLQGLFFIVVTMWNFTQKRNNVCNTMYYTTYWLILLTSSFERLIMSCMDVHHTIIQIKTLERKLYSLLVYSVYSSPYVLSRT